MEAMRAQATHKQEGEMSTRESYTASQWETIQQAPILASLYVMTGDRPGPFEVFRETWSIYRALTHEPPANARNELTEALIADMKQGETPPQSHLTREGEKLSPKEARERALQGVLDAVAIVALVSPDEVEGFRRFLYHTADATARSVKEGGFLGIGGKPVSIGEEAMLAELADSLAVAPQP
jgi:hypothetical protein